MRHRAVLQNFTDDLAGQHWATLHPKSHSFYNLTCCI